MRELVILLVGLAIVAVVLRGLFVALQGRRGQIRLAIDKNIPQDIDLDRLELAELPGGGARTINRSLEQVNLQNSAFDSARAKAAALDLGDDANADGPIPVLMDAVALGKTKNDSSTDASSDELDFDEGELEGEVADVATEDFSVPEDFEDALVPEPAIGAAILEDDFTQQAELETPTVEDPDSVLFDYDEEDAELAPTNFAETEQEIAAAEIDPMQAVAPDYEQAAEPSDEQGSSYGQEDEVLATARGDDPEIAVAAAESGDELESYAEESEPEPELPVFDPADNLDDFSMTAGERIGVKLPQLSEQAQNSLFDELEELPAEEAPKPKRKSLFSLFARKPKPEQEQATPEPEFEAPAPRVAEAEPEVEIQQPLGVVAVAPEVVEEAVAVIDELEQVRATTKPEPVPALNEPSEVVVINVMAKKGRVFAGHDLLHTLITSGLKFGDMNIFHKRLSNDSQGPVIFSVANVLNPGTFDLNNMEEFTTLGISLFLALPSPINNVDAFEQMLDIAQQIIAVLDGELKDDQRNGMTAQTIEHYRQRIRDFELLRLRTAGARA